MLVLEHAHLHACTARRAWLLDSRRRKDLDRYAVVYTTSDATLSEARYGQSFSTSNTLTVLSIMATSTSPGRRRIGYNLRSSLRCQDQQRFAVENTVGQSSRAVGNRELRNISLDSAYFTSPEGGRAGSPAPPPAPLQPDDVCPTKNRSATWRSSLQQQLALPPQESPDGSCKEPELDLCFPEYLVGCTANVPESVEELDRFLFEVWTKDTVANPRTTTAPVSQYVKKVSELRLFYDQKMSEVAQREAAYLSEVVHYQHDTSSLNPDPLSSTDSFEMKQDLLEAKVNFKFDQMRYKLKKKAAEAVAHLRARYIAENGRKKKRLPQKATKLLNEWFEQHFDNPYPSEEEKKTLSTRCEITLEQVARWFANKRSRNKTKTVRETIPRRSNRSRGSPSKKPKRLN